MSYKEEEIISFDCPDGHISITGKFVDYSSSRSVPRRAPSDPNAVSLIVDGQLRQSYPLQFYHDEQTIREAVIRDSIAWRANGLSTSQVQEALGGLEKKLPLDTESFFRHPRA